jgi:hypothetical protein
MSNGTPHNDIQNDIPLPRHTLATDTTAGLSTRAPPDRLLAVRKRRRLGTAGQTAGTPPKRGPGSGASFSANAAASSDDLLSVPDGAADDDDDFPLHAAPSDTQVALMALRAEWPGEGVTELERFPQIVLVSQLYALVANRAAVDREIEAMRATNELRYIKLTAMGTADYAVVLTADLRAMVERTEQLRNSPTVKAYFDILLPNCTQVSVTQAQISRLLESNADNGGRVDYATRLIRAGLLTVRDEDSFWFSIPCAGFFSKMRTSGNRELISLLKRAPYREILLAKLELRRLRSSSFPALFHIRDCIGSGDAETVSTTLGTLVRFRGMAEDPFGH